MPYNKELDKFTLPNSKQSDWIHNAKAFAEDSIRVYFSNPNNWHKKISEIVVDIFNLATVQYYIGLGNAGTSTAIKLHREAIIKNTILSQIRGVIERVVL